MYKDLLFEILSGCGLSGWKMFVIQGNEQTNDVNYADIISSESEATEPNQKLC